MVRGQVASLDGKTLAGASVWLAPIGSTSHPLARTQADGSGNFSLELNLSAQPANARRFVVSASSPGYLESRELVAFESPSDIFSVKLFLRPSGESWDQPSLDMLEAWLLPRLNRLGHCRGNTLPICQEFQEALAQYQQQPTSEVVLERVLQMMQDPHFVEGHLLGALALMRMGAWGSVEKILASMAQESTGTGTGLAERSLTQGILPNFLGKPEEATPALQRALRYLPHDGLVELELGRAAVLDQDWLSAEYNLKEALTDHAPAPPVHYLLAQALLAQGRVEEAYLETKAMARAAAGRPLPRRASALVAEVLTRLGESFNVITQPIGELTRAVPALRGLDSSSPPPPEGLDEILKRVGRTVENVFQGFTQTGAEELLRQTRVGGGSKAKEVRESKTFYIIVNRTEPSGRRLEEYRANKQGKPVAQGGLQEGFMATEGFASSLILFHPERQPGNIYRFLGRQLAGRHTVYVVAFAQKPGVSSALATFRMSRSESVSSHLQGIAWITADEYQILRLHTDLLYPLPEIEMKRLSSDIDYRPRRMADSPQLFWLPVSVTVALDWGTRQLRNQHLFSDFRLFKVDMSQAPAEPAGEEAKTK